MPRRWSSSSPARIVAGLLLALAAGGCRDERGATYECTCTFLTDFDDGSFQRVSVCAPSDERAPDIGRGCASGAAPAPVERCTCAREKRESGCVVGACRIVPRD